jgi:hypothetical protein
VYMSAREKSGGRGGKCSEPFEKSSRKAQTPLLRKSAGTAIESQVTGGLKPWREVVNPHKDVASGRYQQAEFAADLWQVHLGEGSDEYLKPIEFFRRTFLTESLKQLLITAVRRLTRAMGDPVVQLQTNCGGAHHLVHLNNNMSTHVHTCPHVQTLLNLWRAGVAGDPRRRCGLCGLRSASG